MPFKPMDPHEYLRYIRAVGWSLVKGSIDWKLYDENGHWMGTIIIHHSGGSKQQVSALSVKKTERAFRERGLSWPPKKK